MSKPHLLETIHDADPGSDMQADIYGRFYKGVVYFDADIYRTYVHNGQRRQTHRIPVYLEVRRRYLSRKVQQWEKDNKARIQALAYRGLRQLRKK